MPSQDIERREICRIGRSLFERGYVHATAGNISVRLDESQGGGFLITPTDACLGFLAPERLAWVDADGELRSGERASKTLALHRRLYAAAPEARCILHTHSSHLVALTLQGVWSPADIVPPLTPYYVMKVGEDSVFKRPFSFPVAPRTRRPTRLSRCLKVAEIR